jgi:hypothetical protein
MLRLVSAALLYLVVGAATAQGLIVTRCVAPSGYTYYPVQPLVPEKQAGWNTDAIKDGAYLLMRRNGDQFDIVFSDSMNRTVSSVDDGAQIVLIDQSEQQMVFLVHYPKTNIETWYFRIDGRGRGEVTVSQARFGATAFIQKHGLMRAACAR